MVSPTATKHHFPAIMWSFGIALTVIALALTVLNPFSSPDNASGKIKIVAAENFWGNIASQIGGDHVSVTSIVADPTTDPHLYESDAHAASTIAAANIVVVNGLGYDGFIDKLLGASTKPQRQVLRASSIFGITSDTANPHLWYDLPNIHLIAESIEQALVSKDPVHQADYVQNLASFNASLKPALDALAHIKSTYPGAPVAFTERVPGYLLTAAGLNSRTPAGFASAVEDGTDPSPAEATTMDNLMMSRGVKVLLYNSQATSAATQHVRDLATAAAVPVVGVSETIPANEINFQSWQLHQLQAITKALQSQ